MNCDSFFDEILWSDQHRLFIRVVARFLHLPCEKSVHLGSVLRSANEPHLWGALNENVDRVEARVLGVNAERTLGCAEVSKICGNAWGLAHAIQLEDGSPPIIRVNALIVINC